MNVEILHDEPLARYVAWRIGGPARYFAQARTADDLQALVAWGREQGVPIFMLGGGTNILIGDRGFPGLVIRNRAAGYRDSWKANQARSRCRIGRADGRHGTPLDQPRLLAGLQWAEGLPGTVGGAIYGNAGCYGGDTATTVIDATMLLA